MVVFGQGGCTRAKVDSIQAKVVVFGQKWLNYCKVVVFEQKYIYLSDDLERLQKRALRIILPEKTYAAALESTGLAMMYDRRQTLTERLFSDIVSNKDHALHSLLPKVNCARPLRLNRCFNVPICKTNRFKNSFIMCNSSNCLESK